MLLAGCLTFSLKYIAINLEAIFRLTSLEPKSELINFVNFFISRS